MNFAFIGLGAGCIAFLLRFLVALQRETKASSRRASVHFIAPDSHQAAAKVLVMKREWHGPQLANGAGKRMAAVALAAMLLTISVHAQEKAGEAPASAQEVRELRELVLQLQAKVASLEKPQPQPTVGENAESQPASAGAMDQAKRGGPSVPSSPTVEGKYETALLVQTPAQTTAALPMSASTFTVRAHALLPSMRPRAVAALCR